MQVHGNGSSPGLLRWFDYLGTAAFAVATALLLRTMDLLRVFDHIFILTEGGPGFATETLSLYIYRTAFRFSNFGYAAAAIMAALSVVNLKAGK